MRHGLCKMFSQNSRFHHPETLKGVQEDYTGVAFIFMLVLSGMSSGTCGPFLFPSTSMSSLRQQVGL